MTEPNIFPLTLQQADRKRKKAKADGRMIIPKRTRITSQSAHTSALPHLTDICNSNDDIADPDFISPIVELDDKTIIKSGDQTIIKPGDEGNL